MTSFRIPEGGSRIDRARAVSFTYAGKRLSGHAGDTLASALLANGIGVVGRSFKYHRPRGVVADGAAETNALMQVGEGPVSTANVPAGTIALHEGLVARPVNCWPSARLDLAGINSALSSILTAGFYYKTFMWPSWHTFEGFIRRAAGLGRAARGDDPQRYQLRHWNVGMLVIGPAALPDGIDPVDSLLITEEEPSGTPGAGRMLARTRAIAALDHGLVLAAETVEPRGEPGSVRERLHLIRAGEIRITPTLQVQPLVFANNDLPGIMLAPAARALIEDYAVAPGRRLLIAAPPETAQPLTTAATEAGIEVVATIDPHAGDALIEAKGRGGVSKALVRMGSGPAKWIACDCVAMDGGAVPAIQLFLQAGGSFSRDPETGALKADGGPVGIGFLDNPVGRPGAPIPHEVLGDTRRVKASFVDFQTDVTLADIRQAAAEGYVAPDHLKRYTVLGMGTDQGRLSALNGSSMLAAETGAPLATTLPTKSRPPSVPTAFATLGAGRPPGELLRPRRFLPAHRFHLERGAVMEDYGWQRPSHYPQGSETLLQSARREALAVREAAGLFDGSPLGKIEVKGPEAGAFLDHIYVGRLSTLKPGKVRYGLMLDENGTVFDDGVVMRLADDHFLLNCTSGHAERVAVWLEEYRQCIWRYDVLIQPVTSHWATFALAGPRARDILLACDHTFAIGREEFPHMSAAVGEFEGRPARLARVSFSGEVSFELSVPTLDATAIAEILWERGAPLGLAPYGVEALEILRIEKGYIHIGTDTDGETQPGDIGFGRMWPNKPVDFVGRRSLLRPASRDPRRRQLVGLLLDDPAEVAPMGAHVTQADGRSQGWVTSSCFSPKLERGIALAMIEAGRSRHGETVTLYSLGKTWRARITAPNFLDQGNERLDG